MSDRKSTESKSSNRYVNDLKRYAFSYGALNHTRSMIMPFAVAATFLVVAGIIANASLNVTSEDWAILIAASIIGGYMALNIGANDVANNMGPAVGSKVLTVFSEVKLFKR